MKLHELKILPEYADQRRSGKKTDELRKDDRWYEVGDLVLLQEWQPAITDINVPTEAEYTGWAQLCRIDAILRNHEGLAPGWCILHLAVLETRR